MKEHPPCVITNKLWQFPALLREYLHPGTSVNDYQAFAKLRDVKKLTDNGLDKGKAGKLLKRRGGQIPFRMRDVLAKLESTVTQHQEGSLFSPET